MKYSIRQSIERMSRALAGESYGELHRKSFPRKDTSAEAAWQRAGSYLFNAMDELGNPKHGQRTR